MRRLGIVLLASALVAPGVGLTATITVVNLDGAGEGFNDATAVAPVGGNAGTTRGMQRLIAFQYAADIWGAILASGVEIRVGANFDPLPCNATSATLGQAGPETVFRDFAGAPVAATWYPVALASALAGVDLDPGGDDVGATFNSVFGAGCAFPGAFYYGLDASPPGGQTDFVSVVLHELGHGLGFLTVADIASGARLLGFDDVFMLDLEDHSSGVLWPSMSNAQRVASSIDTGDLHWVGPNVVADSGFLAGGRHASGHVEMFAPNPQQGGSSVSHFSTSLTPNEVMEPVYTGAIHAPSLAVELMMDLGWTLAGPPPTSTTSTSVTTTTSTSTTTTLPPFDHYMCDKAATNVTAGGVKFDKLNLPTRSLEDFLLTEICSFRKENFICAPAEKNGEGPPVNPAIHYLSYQVSCPTPLPFTTVSVVDQFNPGGTTVRLAKRFNVLVPAAKIDLGPVPPLPPQTVPPLPPDVLDHFLCYKVRAPRFLVPLPVTVTDQFYPGGYPGLALYKMTKFCAPVNKGNEDPAAPSHSGHFACYQAKLPRGTVFTKPYISTNNDNFGSQVLKVTNTAELCVPAL